MRYFIFVIFFISGCALDSNGKGGSSLGDLQSALSGAVSSVKDFDDKISGRVKNDFPIEKTILNNLYDGKPFEDTEGSSYPRVALTVLKSPLFHSDLLPTTGSGLGYDNGCFTLSATVWYGKDKKAVVDRFDFCTPSDGAYGVPLSGLGTWVITQPIIGPLAETSTGAKRTDGPGVPKSSVPNSPKYQKYYRSTWIEPRQYDGFMFASVLYKMGFDWSNHNDKRVWIVKFSDAEK